MHSPAQAFVLLVGFLGAAVQQDNSRDNLGEARSKFIELHELFTGTYEELDLEPMSHLASGGHELF